MGSYNSDFEKDIYRFWEENGFFKPEINANGKPFSMVIPPPNVTGALHIGHALNQTLQDIIARYKRMCGYSVLWLPGTDHAGIATQTMVERDLARKGIKKDEIGRQAFIEKIWEWKNTYGNKIIDQVKGLVQAAIFLDCALLWMKAYQEPLKKHLLSFTMQATFTKVSILLTGAQAAILLCLI